MKYYERLDSFGVDLIKKQLKYYESFGKPVVLLCFEDVRKGGINNWCHRTLFSKWWQARTGEIISELKDSSAFKSEGKPIDFPKVPAAYDEIRFVLTDRPEVQVYKKNKDEETELTFEEAKRLIDAGKANIKDIELVK